MRVDDWDEDGEEEPVESAAVAPAPVVVAPLAPATPDAPPADALSTDEAEVALPEQRPKPPLSAVLPIYIIGIVSISTICLMFAIVMVLIFTR